MTTLAARRSARCAGDRLRRGLELRGFGVRGIIGSLISGYVTLLTTTPTCVLLDELTGAAPSSAT